MPSISRRWPTSRRATSRPGRSGASRWHGSASPSAGVAARRADRLARYRVGRAVGQGHRWHVAGGGLAVIATHVPMALERAREIRLASRRPWRRRDEAVPHAGIARLAPRRAPGRLARDRARLLHAGRHAAAAWARRRPQPTLAHRCRCCGSRCSCPHCCRCRACSRATTRTARSTFWRRAACRWSWWRRRRRWRTGSRPAFPWRCSRLSSASCSTWRSAPTPSWSRPCSSEPRP